MQNILYLDMDGVLCDFYSLFHSLYDTDGKFNEAAFEDFVFSQRGFEKLQKMKNTDELLSNVFGLSRRNDLCISILSSAASPNDHVRLSHVENQKRKWISQNLPEYEFTFKEFVRHKGCKALYANKNTYLIDDDEKNVSEWIEAGGRAVLWNDNEFEKCMYEVMLMLSEFQ